jgi:toluene monooxygenase system protein E
VVTARFHYHFRREPAPFELDPGAPLNRWYLKYREGSPFQVDDWEGFRDPDRLTYRDYVGRQHEREVYLDGVIDRLEAEAPFAGVTSVWPRVAGELLVPLRFPLHVLQMVGLYVGQMAPSSFITNAAHFQAADEMRRIQRLAYWTKLLADAFDPLYATTAHARTAWEDREEFQPLRQLLEELLVAYDWGEAFAALNLAVKPAVDAAVNTELARLAGANGDGLLAALLTDFGRDTQRSAAWSTDLVAYATGGSPELRDVLASWTERWAPRAADAVGPLEQLAAGASGGQPVALREAALAAQARLATA